MKNKTKTSVKEVNSFAKNLQSLLDGRDLSQRAAAEIAGVSVSTLNDWLTGSAPKNMEAVLKLAKGLNCDFQWLLTGEASQKSETENLNLSQIFSIEDEPSLSGLFMVELKRLTRRK